MAAKKTSYELTDDADLDIESILIIVLRILATIKR